jgi:beta-ureidopropionase / N-carbamoyl-L-amino-acid hydrolase
MARPDTEERFAELWRSLEPIGRDTATGGYVRYSWSQEDLACRAWFAEQAEQRGLAVRSDRNGNLWAWLGDPASGNAVVTGSHLDSVPQGGCFDGPLGIVCGLLAIDMLREQGYQPARPIGIAVFSEEEGARFGVACLGSRLLCGAIDPDRAQSLVDQDGISLVQAMTSAGVRAADLGPEPEQVAGIGTFVELHIEQGRALVDLDRSVGVASAIWPHGRWRIDVTGEGNHAGTTHMADRRDPMLTAAYTVLAANKEARLAGARATVGRLSVHPNATNAVPSWVSAWLDARAADQSTLDQMVAAIRRRLAERAERDRTTLTMTEESTSDQVDFDAALRSRLAQLVGATGPGSAPVLATGAGHDAGVLAAAGVPTAMLFVRNPTGISHAPAEHATVADCAAGADALARVLADLAGP